MNRPIEVNLSFARYNLNDQIGGNAVQIIRQLPTFEFNSLISPDLGIYYRFNSSENSKLLDNSRNPFMGNGTFTAVYSVYPTNISGNRIGRTAYVLRVQSGTLASVRQFMSKFQQDRQIVGQYLPEITHYGVILLVGQPIPTQENEYAVYTIMRKYNTKISSTSLKNRITCITTLLECIIQLNKHRLYLPDLKYDNIAITTDGNCILIDYDENTIIPHGILSSYTFLPVWYHTLSEFKGKFKVDLKEIYTKISIIGLLDVVLNLFYTGDQLLFRLYHGHGIGSQYIGSKWHDEAYLNLSMPSVLTEFITKLTPVEWFGEWLKPYIYDPSILIGGGMLCPMYDGVPSYQQLLTSINQYYQRMMLP